MVITILFAFFIGFLIADNIFTKKDIKKLQIKIKEQDEDIKKAFQQISGILNTQSKTMKLIQKMKSSISKEISNIVHDLDDLYNFSAKETKTINNIMKRHNDLTDFVIRGFKDVHCDINDCDCSICSFHDCCSNNHLSLEQEELEDIGYEEHEENGPIACKEDNKIIIDPKNINSFNKLEKAMAASGVPKEIIDNYVTYIKEACQNYPHLIENKTLEIIWQFGKEKYVGGGLIKHKFVKNKEDNKRVDPHAKIVKTLNKLYERDNK